MSAHRLTYRLQYMIIHAHAITCLLIINYYSILYLSYTKCVYIYTHTYPCVCVCITLLAQRDSSPHCMHQSISNPHLVQSEFIPQTCLGKGEMRQRVTATVNAQSEGCSWQISSIFVIVLYYTCRRFCLLAVCHNSLDHPGSRLVDCVATLLWMGVYGTFVACGTCDEVAFPRVLYIYIYIYYINGF